MRTAGVSAGWRLLWLSAWLILIGAPSGAAERAPVFAGPVGTVERRLYVAVPGVRDYLEYGGHGVLVFDIDREHRFLRRIPARGLGTNGRPLNVKGICANPATGRLYVSTLEFVTCYDLVTDRLLWERAYPGGCDRLAIDPLGHFIYVPSLEKDHWNIISAGTGDLLHRLEFPSGSHNTLVSLDGRTAYLAGLRSPLLRVADTQRHQIVREVGPFSAPIRPFTVNGRGTVVLANVNNLLGFEVGDLVSGRVLHRVEVPGFKTGPVKRHGCPSHGIGLTPDEREVWVTDAANERLHVFDFIGFNSAPTNAPRYVTSIALRDQPGWVTFSLDGRYAYPSTGQIIDVATRRVIGLLREEKGQLVQSEKMLEVQLSAGKVIRTGDQFGVGRRVVEPSR